MRIKCLFCDIEKPHLKNVGPSEVVFFAWLDVERIEYHCSSLLWARNAVVDWLKDLTWTLTSSCLHLQTSWWYLYNIFKINWKSFHQDLIMDPCLRAELAIIRHFFFSVHFSTCHQYLWHLCACLSDPLHVLDTWIVKLHTPALCEVV